MGFSSANPRAQPEGLPSENPEAFRLSRGEVLQTTPRLFNSLSDFGFLEVPRGFLGRCLEKVHCKSQTAPIGNQSLGNDVHVNQGWQGW